MATKMAQQQQETIVEIPLRDIRFSTTNPRKTFDEAKLQDLAASIRASGVQVPLVLRPIPAKREQAGDEDITTFGYLELVFGERRVRAAEIAGKETVPCVIRTLTDQEARELRIVENLQREDVHPMEEAAAYRELGLQHPEDIARRVGKPMKYVAQRLKLLDLIEPAQLLFAERHLLVEHAVILATLCAADQEKALRHMIDIGDRWKDKPLAELVDARRKDYADELATEDGASRLIRTTESELRAYVRTNVMLDLAKAPWSLDDAQLVPEAGPCATCVKRTGGNAALFAELTAEENQCTDAACFEAKHKAFVQITTTRAKEAGEPLLKLSAKSGHKKLPEPVKESFTFRNGQWLKAEPGSCKAVRNGILQDDGGRYSGEGLKAGVILSVCVDQRCKAHKHTVESSVSGAKAAGSSSLSYEEQQRIEKQKREAYLASEHPVRVAVVQAIMAAAKPGIDEIRKLALATLENVADVCLGMGWKYPAPKEDSQWGHNNAAKEVFDAKVMTCTVEQLAKVVLIERCSDAASVNEWQHGSVSDERKNLWALAKDYGVDATAIAKRAEKASSAADDAELAKAAGAPAPKPAAKKAAAKKAPAKAAAVQAAPKKGQRAKPAKLSPEKRKKIVAGMKKRWATKAKGNGKGKAAAA